MGFVRAQSAYKTTTTTSEKQPNANRNIYMAWHVYSHIIHDERALFECCYRSSNKFPRFQSSTPSTYAISIPCAYSCYSARSFPRNTHTCKKRAKLYATTTLFGMVLNTQSWRKRHWTILLFSFIFLLLSLLACEITFCYYFLFSLLFFASSLIHRCCCSFLYRSRLNKSTCIFACVFCANQKLCIVFDVNGDNSNGCSWKTSDTPEREREKKMSWKRIKRWISAMCNTFGSISLAPS